MLVANNQVIDTVNIQRGIYQGSILSPLLFCRALNPWSALLAENKCAYKFKDKTVINHLFYTDDMYKNNIYDTYESYFLYIANLTSNVA